MKTKDYKNQIQYLQDERLMRWNNDRIRELNRGWESKQETPMQAFIATLVFVPALTGLIFVLTLLSY